MTWTYRLPGIPPSNNQYIGRTNYREYQRVKKEWAEHVALCCRLAACGCPSQPLRRAVVTLTYHFPDKRRRDPDNFSGKMLLDGLVHAGILADDSFDNIDLRLEGWTDGQGYTAITIEEGEA